MRLIKSRSWSGYDRVKLQVEIRMARYYESVKNLKYIDASADSITVSFTQKKKEKVFFL